MLGCVPLRTTELDEKNEHEADNCWSKNVGYTKKFSHVSLCAGYGGIDLGLHRAISNLRTIAYSEIEGFAVANLVAKMEAGLMDCAPLWTDLKTFPWEEFRDRIHILSGGYPCQPFSAAGKRLGANDPRHLWPFIREGIKTARPLFCFFENVEGHLSLGFREVQQSLRRLGYSVEVGIFSASECGAPHQRKRLFILAHRNGCGGWEDWMPGQLRPEGIEQSPCHCRNAETTERKQIWPARPGEDQYPWEPPRVVANSKGKRSRETRGLQPGRSENRPAGQGEERDVGDSECGGLSGVNGWRTRPVSSVGCAVANAESSESRGVWRGDETKDPRPSESCGGRECEYRETEPALGRNADGVAGGMDYAELCVSGDSRIDELRMCGNGVVPSTAQKAFGVLCAKLMRTCRGEHELVGNRL